MRLNVHPKVVALPYLSQMDKKSGQNKGIYFLKKNHDIQA